MNSSKPFKNSVDRKKITSIILTAIMLLSIFSGISASVAGNNNNRVGNNVASPMEDEGVGAMAVGSLAASLHTSSPSANIANSSANFTNVFWIRFTASGESSNITNITITEAGTIHGTSEIIGVGVNDTGGTVLAKSTFSADNGTATLTIPGGFEVPVGTLKDLYLWVNTTGFPLGRTIKLTLTSFNATGLASGQAVTTSGVPLSSNEIAGTGRLTAANGPSDVASRTVNAGANTTGIVLAQLNFSAEIEGCTLNTVMLTENGTANGTQDFSAIYLVNDTDSDGVWDSNEPIVGTTVTTFSKDNGSATISGISKAIPLNGWLNLLVVVNTTNQFWSGNTLKVNITNATDFTATGATSGAATGTYGTPSSNTATGQAMIQVAAGAKQPYLSYVLEGQRALVESAQLNFTAIAGQVNITQITLEQSTVTNWTYAAADTFPKVYIDVDEDGNVTALDTPLNLTALNFKTNNVTLASYDTTISGNFSDYAKLANGTFPYIHIVTLTNDTMVTASYPEWWYNISITYVNSTHATGQTNTTWSNITNVTVVDAANDTWWPLDIGASEIVRDITDISFVTAHNVSAVDIDIVAGSQVIDVVLDSNLTIGSVSETTAGQASKIIIIAVNTTSAWTSGNYTKALPNTITKYGNFSNYVAYDDTTGQMTRIYQNNDPLNTSMKQLSAAVVGAVSNPEFKVQLGANTPTSNVGKSTNLAPVMQLSFSYGGVVGADLDSKVYLRELIISTNGTINESNNVTACLVVDTNGDGAVSAGETIVASVLYSTNNQTIKFTLATPIEIMLNNKGNMTSEALIAYKHLLIAFNTSSNIVLGETIRLYMDNSSVDYIADTGTSMVVNQTSAQLIGNALTAAGSITATNTNAVTAGTVSSVVDETYVELIQLKFTASSTEAVNITSINVTWNGTGNGYEKTSGIGVINDTDMDGVWDITDTEPMLNKTTIGTNNLAFLNVSYDNHNITVPAGGSAYVLIYVNTTATSINTSDKIALNITAAPYLNYSAEGNASKVIIADLQTTTISSATMTAAWTGSISAAGYNLTDKTWVEGAQTNFPVLALNFTATNETANITSMVLSASGTANESGNVTLKLVEDVAPFGSYESETILATATFTADNGAVTLTPSSQIQVVGGSYTKVLVVADITAKVEAGTSLVTSLLDPSVHYNAVGYYSGARIQDASTTAVSNTTWSTGNITVLVGANNTITGPVDALNNTYVEVMQLNFSATFGMENVNITGINLTAMGTDPYNDTWGVGLINDTNANGLIDAGEAVIGNGTFDVNGTAVINFDFVEYWNLTVNGSAVQEWANQTFNNTIVYVNTSSNFNASDWLQLRLESYNATGVTSGQSLTAFGTTITSNKLTGTGNVTAMDGASDVLNETVIKSGVNTSVVVWQLKLTAGAAENITITSIDISENGTANAATDIASIYLVNDTNANGLWNTTAGDSGIISNAGTFTADDGTVTLTLTANNTVLAGNSVNYLLVVNTASTFYEGETLSFFINRSAPNGEPTRVQGMIATGATSETTVYNNFTFSPASNKTIGSACIDVYDTTQTTVAIYNQTATNKEVLRVNFSAPQGAVNITNITLRENGSALVAPGGGIQNVSVWYNGVCYNSTLASLWSENGTLRIETVGMVVNGTTNEVTIKVNTTSALATGQTINFELNRTLGNGYNASGNVSLNITSSQTGNISNLITVQGAPSGEISLKAGWNFISVPKKQDTTKDTFGELLAGWTTWTAYSYNAATSSWTSLTASSSINDDVLAGYWVYVDTAGTVYLSYKDASYLPPPSKALTGNAWNAIGFSNTTAQTAENTLKSVDGSWSTVIGWDATSQSYQDAIIEGDLTSTMNPFQGYWVWMTQDDTLSAISA
ncbi:MAG: hypothetical protein PHD13_03215 [Methanocellales archaeon]|nr:hypothetical protein [Methanocellales archaeon]MDD3291598.1 hypothetical protein [Methanocellales archaeon]MDD5235167.1 hypothetical protein [Methanocellales archaeon]MDD5485381.1 hypothetical protein [Methanocellales archaeon]